MRIFRFGIASIIIILGAVCITYLLFQFTPRTTSLTQDNFAPILDVPSPTPAPEKNIRLIFGGDVMLDRNIRIAAQRNGYDSLIGPQLKKLLHTADTAIVNLEGPITSNQSVSVGSAVGSTRNFLFTFSPESTQFLLNHNISLVNLGNNHILNFGQAGMSETYQFLDQAGIQYFGFTGVEQSTEKFTAIKKIGGYTFGFVNYNQFIWEGETQVFTDLEKLRSQVDYLIVYTHWGNEYVPENQVLKTLAHRFVDSGADLVIGSHPHVITGNEIYQGKHIYYSLGNFIFDQYFEPAVQKGLVIEATINPLNGETLIKEHTVSISKSGQTELEETTTPTN